MQPKPGPGNRWQILVADDDPAAIALLKAVLSGLDVTITGAETGAATLEIVKAHPPGLVLLDLIMPDVRGLELLDQIQQISPETDVILITAHYSTDSAVEAIQRGAFDYLTKPISIDKLRQKIIAWTEQKQRRTAAHELETKLVEISQCEGLLGMSPAMMEVFSRLERIAPHYSTALVTGETGTGKEVLARVLHQLSPVCEGPFVVCNCAALPESLFESELFGHVRGAYTGAVDTKKGLVEASDGGTLFLDEIAEVPVSVQAKLLRVLQNRQFQRVGDPTPRKVNVRIICATHRNLRTMVDERLFREDLYYRLAHVELRLPRLIDRQDDLRLLVHHFLNKFGEQFGKPGLVLSRAAKALAWRYPWPGNVRELENSLNYCAMMCRGNVIDVEDFPESISRYKAEGSRAITFSSEEDLVPLEEVERRYVQEVLDKVQGNRTKAAEILGIGRATLYRILSRSGRPEAEHDLPPKKNHQSA